MKWDWDDTIGTIAASVIVIAILFGAFAISREHKVDGYYVSVGVDNHQPVSCVYAHWTWHADELAYCSDDKDKVLDFAAKANALVKR